ncbi:hypothetical protein LCM10_13935 [Rossellomorea aquimaris]|uniref:hypothetical protein n=1 Tax=Rossellomorea aquimaris TaxID=189382 RepID=UPI001CD4807E|nr:hypothetical protein [Rossellomorea aquimaris]MCA1056095.1 hypothetical protein [Rossellomorea aquimaris]
MKLNKNKTLILLLMLLSWGSLFVAGKESLKKYLPSAAFMSLLVILESIYAEKNKWWTIKEKLFPGVNGNIPFVIGLFLSGSVWILKWTYKNFYLFLFVNMLVDTFYVYPFTTLSTRLGVGKLLLLKRYQLSLLFFVKSLLLYGFQRFIVDRFIVKDPPAERH